ncbi:MAG: pyruvate, phosphate dikinase, partial [Oscillospiraceae bacterium]|nr:pyruvate, phosphate dikinase [Oscillospiraceae bacterium]
MRNLLGGKGANLAEMTGLGMPVPQGFTVTTEACTRYYDDGKKIDAAIVDEIFKYVAELEKLSGKKFGDNENPMLLSVRSGARASMPGMMDTVLNLGLNDSAVEGVAKLSGNPRFAYDSYRRFIQMFSDVVMDVPKHSFEVIIDEMKEAKGIKSDTDFTADDMKEMVVKFKAYFKEKKGFDFPGDPKSQLIESITAVFRSWDNPRANYYRMMNNIPYSWGTAVNVQLMVFGNMGNDCGTGVAFSRNPSTCENKLYGEFLMNAQGEDVVAGIRTPIPMDNMRETMPEIYKQFAETARKLELHYKDMQDMEFTIEKGKLYMLQTRNGKRTASAAMQVAVDLVSEGLIDKKQAVLMLDPHQLDALLHPQFDAKALKAAEAIGTGLPASPGAACGKVVFTAESAVECYNRG